jgi:hypothetical protein
VTVGGARGTITDVASESGCRWMGRCDGLQRILLPLLCHFHSIRPQGQYSHLVFYLGL